MAFVEAAKNIVCNIIAVALAMSVSAVAALLPTRPDWLERVNELAMQLKTMDEKSRNKPRRPDPAAVPTEGEPDAPPTDESERLLQAYDHLWQFVHGVRSDGLLLDDKFCERVERDWTVTTLLSYMRNADRALQDKAGKTLDIASASLAPVAPENSKPAG